LIWDCERDYGTRVCFAELTLALKRKNPGTPSRMPGSDLLARPEGFEPPAA
jgi:hypothetical protein